MYLQFYINDNGDKVYTTKKESPVGLATQSAHPGEIFDKRICHIPHPILSDIWIKEREKTQPFCTAGRIRLKRGN
ncbi:hypothetical protein P8452_68138 [Trifolium repens]|nr:hypothetical protein P8452_68138 [Trifolium repens]